ncbi:fungal-specific transcription factor domain-containing protein, partial [Auriculariales sp. MPI-PUGE-AT-0066]
MSEPMRRSSKTPTRRPMSRACDGCRRRKARCDGPQQADGICSACRSAARNCAYSDAVQRPREPPKSYVQDLEARVARAEKLVREHIPIATLMEEVGSLTMNQLPNFEAELPSDDEEVFVARVDQPAPWSGFFGQSNFYLTVEEAANMKDRVLGTTDTARRVVKRPDFWRVPSWEFRHETFQHRKFSPQLPVPSELATLVHSYFDKFNIYLPILHRPLFEQMLTSEEAMQDEKFVAVVLLVCAVGERGLPNGNERTSIESMPAGWEFFEQVEPFLRIPGPTSPRLFDLQIWCLASYYIILTPHTPLTWILFGMTIEIAFQSGAHRRRAYGKHHNLIDEMSKRAFWGLVHMDRTAAASLGRAPVIIDEMFDLEPPLEVDDSLWDLSNPSEGYPLLGSSAPGRHTTYNFFGSRLQLSLIRGIALRTLYSINRSRLLMGFVGLQWEGRMVAKLTNLLRDWQVSLPEHLRWNPNSADLAWFVRAAFLHTTFCAIQIDVHNPFVRFPSKTFTEHSPQASTSLAICTKSALHCAEILAVVIERCPDFLTIPGFAQPAFNSGLVLLVNVYGFKSHLTTPDVDLLMRSVRICLDAMALVGRTWEAAQTQWNIVNEIATGSDYDLPPSLVIDAASRSSSSQTTSLPSTPESVQVCDGDSNHYMHSSDRPARKEQPSAGLMHLADVALAESTTDCILPPGSQSISPFDVEQLPQRLYGHFADITRSLRGEPIHS